MVKLFLAALFFLFILSSAQVFSQSFADTSFFASSVANTKNVYFRFIQGNAHLYNGSEHKTYQSASDEHPYFISDDWAIGSIVYDKELNENVGMMYDLRNDKVIIENYSNNYKIELVSRKISEFVLHGHIFVALKADSARQIQEGFYDQLYNGNVKVYARRVKQYQQRIESSVLVSSFDEKNQYFLFKDGKYFLVNSKSSVLDVLSNKKKLLKQYLSKSQIHYRKEKENALVKLAGFYDTLKD